MKESFTKSVSTLNLFRAFALSCLLLFSFLLSSFSLKSQVITNAKFEFSCPCSVKVTYTLGAVLCDISDVVLYYSTDTLGYSSPGTGVGNWQIAATFASKTSDTHTDTWNCEAAGKTYGLFYYKLIQYPRVSLPVFMAYNLGADPSYNTPKAQMTYLATQTNQLDATVFGGCYQWGRAPHDYAVNSSVTPPLRYSGNGIANRSVLLNANATYDPVTKQILTTMGGGVDDAPNADLVHVYSNASPSDWRGRGAATITCTDGTQCNSLWGNGVAITTPTPSGVLYNGNYYQEPVKTLNDPCPPGYRVPTQDEWRRMGNYNCNPTSSGANFSTPTDITHTTNGLTWVAVRCGGGDCIASNASWVNNTPGSGYAVYRTADWTASGLASGASLISASAPEPFLFLPTAGARSTSSGNVSSVGTYGYYWSSSISGQLAYILSISATTVFPSSTGSRTGGFSVRCVAEL